MEQTTNRCWAATVSECRGGVSREHVFSRGLWRQETIQVSGLPGPVSDKTLHINNGIVTKALCEGHNSELSPLDDAAIDFNNAARRITELRDSRRRTRGSLASSIQFRVQGRLFERWALKTLLNNVAMRRKEFGGWTPASWVADVVFGHRTLPDGAGLALLANVGDEIHSGDAVRFEFGTLKGATLPEVAFLTFRLGFRFLLTWEFPVRQVAVESDGKAYFGATALFPLHRVNYTDGSRDLKLALVFDWSENAAADPTVVKLRERYPSPPR